MNKYVLDKNLAGKFIVFVYKRTKTKMNAWIEYMYNKVYIIYSAKVSWDERQFILYFPKIDLCRKIPVPVSLPFQALYRKVKFMCERGNEWIDDKTLP